jgi:hypothetical protein
MKQRFVFERAQVIKFAEEGKKPRGIGTPGAGMTGCITPLKGCLPVSVLSFLESSQGIWDRRPMSVER